MDKTPILSIEDITLDPQKDGKLRGAWLDAPKKDDTVNAFSLTVIGWALGQAVPVTAVEFFHEGVRIGRVAVNVARSDIAKAFPDATEAPRSGFQASICVVSLPLLTKISLEIILADNTRVNLGSITWRRQALSSSHMPLWPLLISTLGRTGSSWVVRVLAAHPQITAYRPFQFEPRFLSYWMSLLKAVSEESRYSRTLAGQLDEKGWWYASSATVLVPGVQIQDPTIQEQLGYRDVEATACFVLERLQDFYREAARLHGKKDPTYFVEKCWPDRSTSQLISELIPGMKEIVLIRDLRDVICSILSYNKKRGYDSFGRQSAQSDQQFVQNFRAHAFQILTHWRQQASRAQLLRYEDLILRPEETLTKLLDYLNLDADQKTVRSTLDQAAATDPQLQRDHSTSKDAAASIGRWKNDLDATLKGECSSALGDILKEFGYS